MVTIRIPAPSPGLLSNLVGLLGLLGLVVAVGGLTHNAWWSVVTGSLISVGLSYVAHLNAARPVAAVVPITQSMPAPAAGRTG